MSGTRRVRIRYFAAASEAAGVVEQELDVPSDATVGWLRAMLVKTYGFAMSAAIRRGSFLVDGVASTDDGRRIGDRIDVLPPFAGG